MIRNRKRSGQLNCYLESRGDISLFILLKKNCQLQLYIENFKKREKERNGEIKSAANKNSRNTNSLRRNFLSKKEISSKKHIQSDPETCPDRLNVNFTRTCLSDQTLRLYLHFSYSIKTITRVSCCAIRRAEERKRRKKKKGSPAFDL